MNIIKLSLICFLALTFDAKSVVILQYHNVSDTTPKSTSISPKLFKQHLDYLSDNQFKVISLDTLVKSIQQKKELPDKSVMITFDDGYKNIQQNAVPLLHKKGFPFVIFLGVEPIQLNLSQFMSWQDLKQIIPQGASIANHSMTHPHMIRQQDGESDSDWQKRMFHEIQTAQSQIESNLGQKLKAFAYPYGEYNHQLKSILRDLGFIGFAQHSGAFSNKHDLYSIPRFPFGGDYTELDDFILKVNTLPLPIDRIEILDENNYSLKDPVLPFATNKPKLKIILQKDYQQLDLQCYLSGKGLTTRVQIKHGYVFQTEQALSGGRSKFNCTAPSGHSGRYYWFSQLWIRHLDNGFWYEEM